MDFRQLNMDRRTVLMATRVFELKTIEVIAERERVIGTFVKGSVNDLNVLQGLGFIRVHPDLFDLYEHVIRVVTFLEGQVFWDDSGKLWGSECTLRAVTTEATLLSRSSFRLGNLVSV